MYKLTLFMEQSPEVLEKKLVSIGFTKENEQLSFKAEQQTFIISPFGEVYKSKMQGYRILSNFPMESILRIFERSIRFFSPKITAVEYLLNEDRTKESWDFYFKSRPAYKIIDERGIYRHGNVSIIFGGIENVLHLSIRPSRPGGELSLNKCIEELSVLVENIRPSNVDIFTYAAEVI